MSAGFRNGGYDENGEMVTGLVTTPEKPYVGVYLVRQDWHMILGPMWDAIIAMEKDFPNTANRIKEIAKDVRQQLEDAK